MELKKIFIAFLMVFNTAITSAHIAENTDIAILLEASHTYISQKNKNGEFFLNSSHNVETQQILFLIESHRMNQDPRVLEALKTVSQKNPESLFEALAWSIENNNWINVDYLVATEVKPKVNNKEYTTKELFKAYLGIEKIEGVKSKNCNSWVSSLFGKSVQCQILKIEVDAQTHGWRDKLFHKS